MKAKDYGQKIETYCRAHPGLDPQRLAVLLTADLLYEDIPDDLPQFRKKYAHLDPGFLDSPTESITFLKVVQSEHDEARLRDHLNSYMNIKFHDIVHRKSYDENAPIFARHSVIASRVLDDILKKSALPPALVEVLRERDEVRNRHDFVEILRLYRATESRTVRYELMRKLGLIVLIARIDRSIEFDALDDRTRQVRTAMERGLGGRDESPREYWFWLNAEDGIDFDTDRDRAATAYERDSRLRRAKALAVHPSQSIVCRPVRTFSGNEIIHIDIRNKFESGAEPCYTSFIEKMVRKNLEFPNQIHDTVGVKIVVEEEDRIPRVITDLESFLGGSSTRKMEKNTYHRFGRHGLSEYSSEDYFVWKAIYDITLPHPSIVQVEKMLEMTRGNDQAQKALRSRLEFFVSHPRDFVIEVQLQDIRSFLLSITRGSPTEHAGLKMNQIRSNSLYKLFPKEIFADDIAKLKLRLVRSKVP